MLTLWSLIVLVKLKSEVIAVLKQLFTECFKSVRSCPTCRLLLFCSSAKKNTVQAFIHKVSSWSPGQCQEACYNQVRMFLPHCSRLPDTVSTLWKKLCFAHHIENLIWFIHMWSWPMTCLKLYQFLSQSTSQSASLSFLLRDLAWACTVLDWRLLAAIAVSRENKLDYIGFIGIAYLSAPLIIQGCH